MTRRVPVKDWCNALDQLSGEDDQGPRRKRRGPINDISTPPLPRKMSLKRRRALHDAIRADAPWLGMDPCLDKHGPQFVGKMLDALCAYDGFDDTDLGDDHSKGILCVGRTRIEFKISTMRVFGYSPSDREAGYGDVGVVNFWLVEPKRSRSRPRHGSKPAGRRPQGSARESRVARARRGRGAQTA